MSAMRVEWRLFEGNGLSVEGQHFAPEAGARRLVLFCPGFPGAGATVFEQRHAAALTEKGYELVVLRHNGTRLDSPSAPGMLNHAGRLQQARLRAETHLGGGPSTLEAWLLEPLTALRALAPLYDSLYVLGNSFGALSALWSLTEPGAPLAAVRHVVLLAGAQGVSLDAPLDTMRIWRPEFIALPHVTGKVALGPPEDTAAAVESAYRLLPSRVGARLPEDIPLTYVVVARDELLTLADTLAFQSAISGRGTVVIEEDSRAWPELGLMAHDMPAYRTEDLLKLW